MTSGPSHLDSNLASAVATIERDWPVGDSQVKTLVADLRRSDDRTRFALGVARAGVWEAELFTGQVDWSETMHLAMGRSAAAFDGTVDGMAALIHVGDRDKFSKIVQGNFDAPREFQTDVRVVWPDDTTHWVRFLGRISTDAGGMSVRLISVAQDITDQKQLELKLRQSQKMEAMGRLAGGVAHDFNNILTAILGYATLVETEPDDADTIRAHGLQIRKAAERAAGLTRQLLAFSRRQVTERRSVYLNEVMDDLLPMLGKILGEHVRVESRVEHGIDAVCADPGQLQQVILSLAINGRDAMPHGGTVSIRGANVTLGSDDRLPTFLLPGGNYVMLSVMDTGAGADGEISLALATVFDVVKKMDGGIRVITEPGTGTTYCVYLPRTDAGVEAATPPGIVPLIGSGETVLVVEDEEQVRDLVSSILTRNGYIVLTASSAGDARAVVREAARRIDLVVADVMMPDVTGPELVAVLRTMSPTRALFMSGYAGAVLARQGHLADDGAFLQKPFTGLQLLAKVTEVLSAPFTAD